jgi:hopanoid biosynthesis associated radical SAM protein HpnH
MGFSRQLTLSLFGYLLKNKIQGKQRFPLVLMLEPSFRCNLKCVGCGRIREYKDILDQSLSLEECLASAQEADAPVVSITGGEHLLLPEISSIVEGIIRQKRFVNLCTNGVLLEASLSKFKPDPRLFFVVHMDGLAETHDKLAGKQGVFDTAFSAIGAARKAGFQVLINSTVYKQTDIQEIKELFIRLAKVPVNGIMVAMAFDYEAVGGDVFLSRQEMSRTFQLLYEMRKQVPFYNTPLYLDFLAGKINLKYTPLSTPTRNPMGWKRPCYLLTDGHCGSFRELMEDTQWGKYGNGNNARCVNCMVHCGFEASALSAMKRRPANLWRTVKGIYFK